MISQPEVKKNLYTSLKELGLTESEASLYITSLTLGPATIASLAEHLNIPRPNVYKVIVGLEQHGLAKFSERKRYTRTFVVQPPTIVLEKLRQKRETMTDLDQTIVSAMPDLLALYHQGELPTSIRIFHGKEQYLKTFFQILDEAKGSAEFFGSANDFVGFLSWDKQQEWIKKRVARGIKIRSLFLPDEIAEKLKGSDPEQLRETRILKDAAPFNTSFQLFANKVIIWQPKAPLAVLIEDEYIVAMLRSMFDWMWSRDVK